MKNPIVDVLVEEIKKIDNFKYWNDLVTQVLAPERKKLEACVFRLYDCELITLSRAAELLSLTVGETKVLYDTYPEAYDEVL